MRISPRRLAGSFEIAFEPLADERGYFMRWYDRELFASAGLETDWVEANESASRRNVMRGLHFQRPPYAETKLVRAVAGAVFDVFVDLRRGSPTYGQWDAVELSSTAKNAVLVPKGFAHGYWVLTEQAVVSYLVDCAYAPHAEAGLAWNDRQLAISWPAGDDAIVSARDRAWPGLAELEPLG